MNNFMKTETYEVNLRNKREIRREESRQILDNIKVGTQNDGREIFTADGFEISKNRCNHGIEFVWDKTVKGFFKLRVKSVQRHSLLVKSEQSDNCYVLHVTVSGDQILSFDNIYPVGTWNTSKAITK